MYDLIIIGGGAAALAAAYYANGKKLNTVVIAEEVGGKIGWLDSLTHADSRQSVPGNELARLLASRVTASGTTIMNDRVTNVSKQDSIFHVVTAKSGVWQGRTVLVATGAAPLSLGVPGEERFAYHGLGYSITTYAHLAAGRRVAVIGATERALAGAAELARSAEQVFLISPSALDEMMPLVQGLRRQKNVELLIDYQIIEIGGETSAAEVVIVRNGQIRRIEVHGVFVALGLMPNSAMVRDLVETDSQGFIRVNPAHKTSLPGLYAAGDVSTMVSEQVLVAIGDGAHAARSAYEYLLAQRLLPSIEDTQPA